ncbi:peptidoglycan-recognition protein SC2-like [Strongylocentrotus purpuratus]|uniref:Peptidoglycan-recognition protein n=1 Tax=Strongylocentrotus purpuratus TaxID=7668 RepID=A0A7M7N395_STRPU|nr:peptidoglycan-recognition protein SC2-like [Strongylocentrotus purpuratus]
MPIFATMGFLYLAFTSLLVFAVCDCRSLLRPRIISRSEWGARSPTSTTNLNTNLPYAVVHHTATSSCTTEFSCKSRVRAIQNYHMNNKGWSDIGYNFLIGGDGNIYEGRGLNKMGAHASGYNSQSLGVAVIGDFGARAPGQIQRDAMDYLFSYAVGRYALDPRYTLYGHRDVSTTACPGTAFYNRLEENEHFTEITSSVDEPLMAFNRYPWRGIYPG